MPKAVAEEIDMPGPAKDAVDKRPGVARPYGQGESKSARKRKRDKEKMERLENQQQTWNVWQGARNSGSESSAGKGSGKEKGMAHPRKYGNLFVTSRDGVQICYTFAKGQPGSCSEPCPDQRCHCCQHCLGSHPNVSCPKPKSKGGGKSNK